MCRTSAWPGSMSEMCLEYLYLQSRRIHFKLFYFFFGSIKQGKLRIPYVYISTKVQNFPFLSEKPSFFVRNKPTKKPHSTLTTECDSGASMRCGQTPRFSPKTCLRSNTRQYSCTHQCNSQDESEKNQTNALVFP